MALRAQNNSSSASTPSSYHVELPVFWHDANATPSMEWENGLTCSKWPHWQNIRSPSLTREITEQLPRVRSRMGYLDEDPVNKKVVSAMYLYLGEAARKQVRDQFPHTIMWALKVGEFIQMCAESFFFKKSVSGQTSTLFENATIWKDAVSILARVEWLSSYVQFWRDYDDFAVGLVYPSHEQ